MVIGHHTACYLKAYNGNTVENWVLSSHVIKMAITSRDKWSIFMQNAT